MPLAKHARSPRTDYMPLQNLKEHPRTDYIPCNSCVPYHYLIIFRSSHRLTEHNLDTHNTTLTSMTMGGPTCHHVGKALNTYINYHGRPIPPPCQKGSTLTSTTMGGPSFHHVGKALITYINDHGRLSLPPCRKGSCVSASSKLITSPWREPRSEEHQASL